MALYFSIQRWQMFLFLVLAALLGAALVILGYLLCTDKMAAGGTKDSISIAGIHIPGEPKNAAGHAADSGDRAVMPPVVVPGGSPATPAGGSPAAAAGGSPAASDATDKDSDTAKPLPPYACGVDVSHYDGPIRWTAVRGNGISFALIKATESVDLIDTLYRFNWLESRGAGLTRGAYHFFDPESDPVAQAQFFLDNVALDSADLPPILDVEISSGVDNVTLISRVQTWLTTVELKCGRRPIIYTDAAFWNAHMTGNFTRYALWIADWNVTAPRLPVGWGRWQFWQYSERGRVAGIKNLVDLNYFNGGVGKLLAYVAISSGRGVGGLN